MNKFFIFLFVGLSLVLAQDPPPPLPGVKPFKEPVITIGNVSNAQLEGIKYRAAKDGPKGIDPLKWFLSRIEFELDLWATESQETAKADLGKDAVELLTPAELKPIQDVVNKKRAEKAAKEAAEKAAREAKEKKDAEDRAKAEAAKAVPVPGPVVPTPAVPAPTPPR